MAPPRKGSIVTAFPQKKPRAPGVAAGKAVGAGGKGSGGGGGTLAGAAQATAPSHSAATHSSGAAAFPDEDDDQMEDALRQFDLDLKFGPCVGISRMDRWNRAEKLGLSPPTIVRSLLEHAGGRAECLFEGRV